MFGLINLLTSNSCDGKLRMPTWHAAEDGAAGSACSAELNDCQPRLEFALSTLIGANSERINRTWFSDIAFAPSQ
jgi:hypothetical protein